MPAIARNEENRTDLINWFTTMNGTLTDMYEMSFQIHDIAAGLPGTQIFPVAEGTWEDVTNAPGKFSVGAYYAYDSTAGTGWTPGIAEAIGTHRITWRWKATPASPYQADSEDFEVLMQSAGSSPDTYASVADIRAEGLLEADYSDEQVLATINTWQAFLDRACRQWFLPKTMVFSLDGSDSDTMLFGVPIISVDYIKINGSDAALDSDLYRVYSGFNYPDDRHNPRISLTGVGSYDIYSGTGGFQKFLKGRQNQEVKGTFGYVESNGSTPLLIKRALTKLVIEKLTRPMYGNTIDASAAPPIVGDLLERWVDGHKLKWDNAGGARAKRQPGLIGITQDQEILDIIRMYRAPIGAATPQHPSHM